MNKAHGVMVTCSVLASSCDPNALVRPTPAGTNRAYAKIIIQPVRKPAAGPRPRLLYV